MKARRQTVKALDRIINKNEFSNEVVKDLIDEVDDIDQGLFRKLVYGVVENLLYLDYMIQKLATIKLKKIDSNILNILRIAFYEIVFLDTKRYAAINEAVNSSKKYNFKSKGFVNGILRNLDRKLDEVKQIDLKGDDYLSVKYSTNPEIISYLKSHYDNYKDIVATFTQTPIMSIRVNTLLTSKEKLREDLESQGFEIEDSKIANDSILIKNPVKITETFEFENGHFTIQDQSSILVGQILNPSKNSMVLDLCSAPGSKATHLSQIMDNTGFVQANDIAFAKNDKVEDNFERLKLSNYKISNFDARVLQEELKEKFDYVLVDAPCSGLGVVKRKPEIKLNRTFEDIKAIGEIQEDILDCAYHYLKKGGALVYSTCTLGKIENEDQIDIFLNNHKDMEIIKIDNEDYINISPQGDRDGFFICKMLKK